MQKTPSWMLNPPTSFSDKARLLKEKKGLLNSPGRKGKFLRNLLSEVENHYLRLEERAKQIEPLNFFKPSYEQSLLLNAWMYGISFICVYCANRIGKTAAMFINIMLWIYPNNPKLKIFKPYRVGDPVDDPENYDNPHRSKLVQVFPRPSIHSLKLIADAIKRKPSDIPDPNPLLPHYDPVNQRVLQWLQKQVPEAYAPAFPDAPWNNGGTIWFGAPDQDHHEQVMFPMWKSYLPEYSIDRYVPSEREITLKITAPTGRTTVWEIIGKSYESNDTKWSSGAVDAILLTEGVTPQTFKEIKLRFKDPGVGSHDFTPYLPANSGAASHLAQRIANGKEILPLRTFVFTKFSVYNAPVHIISRDKREGLIASYKDDPEGQARLLGEFYSSSMLVLSNLDRENNLLDWSKDELFHRFPSAQLFRGVDPGLDHPTACAWGALLPTNQLVVYRIFSQQGLTIDQRCDRIIALSGNQRQKVYYGPREEDFYWIEVHNTPQSEIYMATICDYHTFKQDETTGIAYAANYHAAGLPIIESVHTGPEDRAILVNGMLHRNTFTPDLRTNKPPGPRLYFLKNEPGIMAAVLKWEEYYWERIRVGDNKGEPKDKVPSHGDDELDGVSYIACSPFRWTRFRPSARLANDSEPEMHLIEQSQSMRRTRSSAQLATSAKAQPQQVVVFGDTEPFNDDEDDDL
jgi:hypothetical protein